MSSRVSSPAQVFLPMASVSGGLVACSALFVLAGDSPVAVHLGSLPILNADRFGSALGVFVCAMTLLVHAFARRSLAAEPHGERFFPAAALVGAATVGVALAASWWAMTVAWLAVSAATTLVLRHDGRAGGRAASRSAQRTFLIGDVAMIGAAWILSSAEGARAADGFASRPNHVLLTISAGLLLAVAASTRGALVPFHGWLRRSVDTPTPVSALLHAGVVNGGGILLIRSAPVVSTSWIVQATVLVLGICSVIIGVAVMRTRADVKGALIWSTIAQMGFMTVQCGLGLLGPAVVHLIAHGMFKAYLFLESGSTVAHTEQRRQGAGRKLPNPSVAAIAVPVGVAALLMTGVVLIVEPDILRHDAGWLPLALLSALVLQSAIVWGRRSHGVTRTALAAVGLIVSVTMWLFAVDAIEAALRVGGSVGSINGDIAGGAFVETSAALVLAVCVAGWIMLWGKRPGRLVDTLWVRCADLGDPGRRDTARRPAPLTSVRSKDERHEHIDGQ